MYLPFQALFRALSMFGANNFDRLSQEVATKSPVVCKIFLEMEMQVRCRLRRLGARCLGGKPQ